MIRAAVEGDIPRIADLHIASWRTTYRNELSSSYLDVLEPGRFVARWRRHLENGVAPLVSESDEILNGFVACGPGRGDDVGDAWEIYAIHVAPTAHGRGIGGELFEAAAERGRQQAFLRLVLWVVRTNDYARAFYERRRMRWDGGEQAHSLGDESLDEVRYTMEL